MAKKFTLLDKLLIGIYFVDEVLDSTIGAGQRAYRAGRLWGWTPPGYKGSLLHQNINHLLKTGYLEKEIIKGEPVLKITRGGKLKLAQRFSYFKMREKHWDQQWRLVIFDISEKEKFLREKLRRKLKELGFGCWQKSIYISPFDLEEDMQEYLEAQRLTGKAYVLTARHRLLGDARELASQVWNLPEIHHDYYSILRDLENKKVPLAGIYQHYLEVLEVDPCLPKELLSQNWVGDKVRKELIKLMGKLT